MSIVKSEKHNQGQCGGYSMDNPKISEDTREKIEEAAVAVFMDQYAAALDAAIDVKMEECVDMEFPPELDKRCRALIQQEYAKQKSKARRKIVFRVCRSAAVVAIALLSLCSVLFMTVEAFRIPVMNFFAEYTNRYHQVSGIADSDLIPDGFNTENPLDGVIPDDFALTNLTGTWEEGCLSADYSNDNNAIISFAISPSSENVQVDSEDAQVVPFDLLGHKALKSVENNFVRITWIDEPTSLIFSLCAVDVSEKAVLAFAETLAMMFA